MKVYCAILATLFFILACIIGINYLSISNQQLSMYRLSEHAECVAGVRKVYADKDNKNEMTNVLCNPILTREQDKKMFRSDMGGKVILY